MSIDNAFWRLNQAMPEHTRILLNGPTRKGLFTVSIREARGKRTQLASCRGTIESCFDSCARQLEEHRG